MKWSSMLSERATEKVNLNLKEQFSIFEKKIPISTYTRSFKNKFASN